MRSRLHRQFAAAIALSTSLYLTGCVGVAESPVKPDPAVAQLASGMERCLASQAATQEQLQRQEQQLTRQQRQLQALGETLQRPAKDAAAAGEETVVACAPVAAEPDKLMVGQLEQVWLQNLQLTLPARIDTGAETASLDARNIELFERDGRRWVRFEILHPETGEPIPLENKLKRMVAIVQSNTAEAERRPVIIMGITIGHISQSAEFTLSNRSHLDHQVLIGRNVLKDVMVVDVSRENVATPMVDRESQGTEAPP